MKRSKSFPSTWPVMYSFDAHIEISQPVCSFQCETTYWIIFEFVCDSFSKRVLVQNLKNEKEFELHENKRIWKTFSYPRYVCLIVNLVFCPWKKFFSRLWQERDIGKLPTHHPICIYKGSHFSTGEKGLQVVQFAWKTCRQFLAIPVLRAPTEDMSQIWKPLAYFFIFQVWQ